ncbi:MAG: TIR domain-containing protein [Parvularculaceae bacterium]
MVETFYRAFISYSHDDSQTAEWLQRKLETFRIPHNLVDRMTSEGSVPRRLTPLFRDQEDLPTSGNLSNTVETALSKSRFLIVLCSPSAAKSEWVNKEVIRFKELNGDRRVLAVVTDGPDSSPDVERIDAESYFPEALRIRYDSKGKPTGERAEPLAADLREHADGRKRGVLKIVAGMIGVDLDDLIQREHHRKQTRLQVAAGALGAAAVAMGALAFVAIDARNEARMQKTQAEGLVEFMLTDLKDKLEAVGRLDVLESVGKRALDYYGAQNLDALDADSLSRRARALLLVGEIDNRRNDLDTALAAYEAAAGTTAELLRREPNNPQRIFDHAQSVFYVGWIAEQRGDLEAAEAQLKNYFTLAERLVAIDENNPKWQLELAYATSNLGAMKHTAGDYDEAVEYFKQSVAARRELYRNAEGDDTFAFAYAYVMSWHAYAEMDRGNFEQAIRIINTQLAVYEPLQETQPDDFRVFEHKSTAYRRLAEIHLALGDVETASAWLDKGEQTIGRLLARDSDNAEWKNRAVWTWGLRSEISALSGDTQLAIDKADGAIEIGQSLTLNGDAPIDQFQALAWALARRVKAGDQSTDRKLAASQLLDVFERYNPPEGKEELGLLLESALGLAEYEASRGNDETAGKYASIAMEHGINLQAKLSVRERFSLFQLCLLKKSNGDCEKIAKQLDEIEYQHPEYMALSDTPS